MPQETINIKKVKENYLINGLNMKKNLPSSKNLYKELNKRSFKLSLERLNAFYISANKK